MSPFIDWRARIDSNSQLTDGRGADHVLEMAGGDNLAQSLQALALGGRISLIGIVDGFESKLPSFPLLTKRATVQGVFVGHRRAQEDMVNAIDRLGIKPVIDAQYALRDLPTALEHPDRRPFGKIVIRIQS